MNSKFHINQRKIQDMLRLQYNYNSRAKLSPTFKVLSYNQYYHNNEKKSIISFYINMIQVLDK